MDKPADHGVGNVVTKRKIIMLIIASAIIVGVTGLIAWQYSYKPEKTINAH